MKKPIKGDPLKVRAVDYRDLLSMVEEWRSGRNTGGTKAKKSPEELYGWNRSGQDLSVGSVVEYDLAAWNETDFDDVKIQQHWSFVLPTLAGIEEGRIGIVTSAMPDDRAGTVAIVGLSYALLNVADAGHKYASPAAASERLLTAETGDFRIVKKLGTGTAGTGFVLLGCCGDSTGGGGGDDSLVFAQAPSGGIPARTLATPGSAICKLLEIATTAGTGYSIGDLINTGVDVTVENWAFDIAAAAGDRVLQISKASSPAFVVGWSCNNVGTTTDIKDKE